MNTSEFYQQIWQDYIKMTPQAEAIEGALRMRGETVVNDHIAFLTFNQGPARLATLEPLILALGYKRFEPYDFAGKKLDAMGYTPPSSDLPRIFISELRVEELSAESQAVLQRLIGQMPVDTAADASVFWRGRAWLAPTFADYKMLDSSCVLLYSIENKTAFVFGFEKSYNVETLKSLLLRYIVSVYVGWICLSVFPLDLVVAIGQVVCNGGYSLCAEF